MDKTIVATLTSLLSVSVGWFLNELTQYLRGRSAHKAAIGRALVELLELRHGMRTVNYVITEIRRRLPSKPTPTEIAQITELIEAAIPIDPDMQRRYVEA